MADAKALTDIATSYTTLAGGDLFGVERSGTVGKFTWNSFQTQNMTLSGDITFTGTVDLSGATISAAVSFAALSASGVLSVASDIQHIGDTNNKIAFGTDTQSFETGGTARLDLSDSGVRFGATGARVTDIETTITDDDTKLPTSGAVVDYVAANGGGWEFVEASYDSAVDGAVANIVCANHEAGYDYMYEVEDLYGTTGTTTVTMQAFRVAAGVYDAAWVVKASNANYFSARYEFYSPLTSRSQHMGTFNHSETVSPGALSLGTTSAQAGFIIKHATTDTVRNIRIQRGAGNIDSGRVRQYRRPIQQS